jgi:uncharacterized protein (DUF1778 family)
MEQRRHPLDTTMSTVTLRLNSETERKLREVAAHLGQTLEAYLEQLAEQNAGIAPAPSPTQELSDEEFERLLDQLSEGPTLPPLPADFSRADIYADHD